MWATVDNLYGANHDPRFLFLLRPWLGSVQASDQSPQPWRPPVKLQQIIDLDRTAVMLNARPAPTLADYRAALAAHDWFYEFSDDHRVWGNGRNQEARLRLMAKTLDPDLTIWKQYAPATR